MAAAVAVTNPAEKVESLVVEDRGCGTSHAVARNLDCVAPLVVRHVINVNERDRGLAWVVPRERASHEDRRAGYRRLEMVQLNRRTGP